MTLIKNLFFSYFGFLSNSYNRDQWVIKELRSIKKGQNILDAGAGECRYKKYCDHLKYISQDFCEYDGKGNNKGLQTKNRDHSKIKIVSDITTIPLKNSSIDNILCTEVLEHLPRPELAIKEFHRLLKKGGKLILTAPFASLTHYSPYHYITGFNIYWYKKILKENGFKITKIRANGNYFDYINQELLRIPYVIKKYSNILVMVLILILYMLILPLVLILNFFRKTKHLNELANFGYFISMLKT
ncbi:methyltransferase domain-containing protein [Candidatus Roizmanbacteria bacterium]|nr:methyltransferase domain-containing protein [Candidatus Roizmanbacteria bacterium]